MKTPFQARRGALVSKLKESKLDCLLVTSPANWYYLTRFTGESGALIVSQRGTALVTDGRFAVQARQETSGVRVVLQKGSLFESAGLFLKGTSARRVGFDPALLTVAQLQGIRRAAGPRLSWISAPGLVEGLRRRKDASELAQMRKAAVLAGKAVEEAILLLRPGIREFEVGAEIEYRMRKKGASGPAFQTIVAFGARAALPHARPTAKRLRKNELVVLDLAGYHLDRLFVHSTGHGLGLEVHEDPRVARGQKKRLEPGNVITIEPGVYSAGIGGIRIEDDVAVHADHTEVLTRSPRDLIEI